MVLGLIAALGLAGMLGVGGQAGVTARVAAATRCRCSSADSWPSASAVSRIWQVSLRSLSFARVAAVATGKE